MPSRDTIEISVTAARWLLQLGTQLIRNGFGSLDDEEAMGVIDEIPMDSEPYHYMNEVLRFVMTVTGILRHNLQIEDGDT